MTDGTIRAARAMHPRSLFERMAETQRLDPPPAECGCMPGHRMTVNSSVCLDCGLTEREVEETGNRPCVKATRFCTNCNAARPLAPNCLECGHPMT